jgi:predicted ATP-grasp superfamily ATP-dependent carboligase
VSAGAPNAAVVFGLTATGLAVARSLARQGVTVYGVDAKRWEVGHHSSEIRRPPFAYEPHGEGLAERVAAWGREQGAPPVLFPADDPSCDFLSEHHLRLREGCLLAEGYRPEVASAFVDKRTFYRRCAALGADLPRTLFPESLEDLRGQIGDLRYPAILKPAHSHLWRHRFGGRKVLEVGSREELLETFAGLGDLKTGMTVQEVIPGPESEIFVCGCSFLPGGGPQALFTARKTRQFPPGFGSGSLMCSEWQPEVARLSTELVGALGYAGVCGTEYKPDPRDGRWKLIEINPRPTLWFSLCRAAGCDVVHHEYRHLVGRALEPQVGRQRDGVRWQYFLRDLISLAYYLRRGELGWGRLVEALSPLRKDEAIASFRDLRAALYYPLYGFRQWRAHARGEDTGP